MKAKLNLRLDYQKAQLTWSVSGAQGSQSVMAPACQVTITTWALSSQRVNLGCLALCA